MAETEAPVSMREKQINGDTQDGKIHMQAVETRRDPLAMLTSDQAKVPIKVNAMVSSSICHADA